MTNSELDYIIKNRKLKLSFEQTLNHYSILIIPTLFLWGLSGFINIVFWIWLITSLLIIINYRRKLNFREFKGSFKNKDILEAIRRASEECDFQIVETTDKYITANNITKNFDQTENRLTSNIIILIFDNDKFLINSVKNPDKPTIQLFASVNKKNIKVFLKHLNDVLKGFPEIKNYKKQKKNYIFKRILLRFFTYPAFIFVVFFGLKMIFHPLNIRQPIVGIMGIFMSLIYFYADITLIIKEIKTLALRYKSNNVSWL